MSNMVPHPSTWSTTTTALIGIGTTLSVVSAWLLYDYNAWVAFGTGGTPPTPSGYYRMTKLRLAVYFAQDNNMRDPSSLPTTGASYLKTELPNREGSRPKIVSRTMPQRQVPEPIDEKVRERVHALPRKFVDAHPDVLVLDLSKTEGKSTDAIYAKPGLPGRDVQARDRILGDEIVHVHPSENSLHVWLAEADARKVVEAGWGERFPLVALGMVHKGWVMLYAPRTMEDVDAIEIIVKAGIEHLTGVRV